MVDDKTHFIGVMVPEEIVSVIEDGRAWMRRKYGCRSGHSTPVHVTVIPPFKAREGVRTKDIVSSMEKAIGQVKFPFEGKTDGFGSFSDRTLFGNVVGSAEWTGLRDALVSQLRNDGIGQVKMEKGPLRPHLSVANRDIPKGAIGQALEYFSTIDFNHTFPVESLVLFVRDGYRWVPGAIVG